MWKYWAVRKVLCLRGTFEGAWISALQARCLHSAVLVEGLQRIRGYHIGRFERRFGGCFGRLKFPKMDRKYWPCNDHGHSFAKTFSMEFCILPSVRHHGLIRP